MTLAIELREPQDGDYPIFFEHRRDPGAARMAAFGTQDTSAIDYAARMKKRVDDGTLTLKTIVEKENVIGFVATFLNEAKNEANTESRTEVTYWIARSHWGRGVATAALIKLIEGISLRPIYASAAKDNVASIRVLEKCGFVIRGTGRSWANARGEEIDEIFFELEA
jgi:RimJ/RimL family protein N-acetyltransferase